ncbi:MAG: hypothetical protein IPH97_04485 [Ignavibacteriales bacterium]|nr:hypothetical protein [Ignavibacteriales bacterium]
MNKVKLLLFIISVVVFSNCSQDPTNVENIRPDFKLSISDTLHSFEAISFIDFKIFNPGSAYENRVDAFYQGKQVGFAFADKIYLDGSIGGTIHLNSFLLPSNAKLDVTAKNNLGYVDTVYINLSNIKRDGPEYYSSTHGGQLVNLFNSVKNGIKVSDGSVWIVTDGGLLIIYPDFSISTHEYSGINGTGGYLLNIISDNQGETRLIDNKGRILKWNGSTYELTGQITVPLDKNIIKVIYANGEYYGIVNYSTGTVLRYTPAKASTIIYTPVNSTCVAAELSKGAGNQILASFEVLTDYETKLFYFQNDEWNEVALPVIDSYLESLVIYCDTRERLWFGYNSELYEATGFNFRLIHIPENLNVPGLNSYCYNNGTIKGIGEDGDGNIWIAKGSGGLVRYSDESLSIYPGVLLSNKLTSCSSEEPNVKQVFSGINGGIFVLVYGSPIGNVLKNLIKE